MSNPEVDLDQHGDAGRQLSAVLSAALAATQAASQHAAERARRAARDADRATAAQNIRAREAEQAARTEKAVRQRQWALVPASQWLHDKPLDAAAAWASADAHRDQDPLAARHAEQWEAVFRREGIDLSQVRANAPAALQAATGPEPTTPQPPPMNRTQHAAAEVTAASVLAGQADHAAQTRRQWTAYADGSPAAQLGGKGVSLPPSHVLAAAQAAPDSAATMADPPAHSVEIATDLGLER